jgi:hypothetical protein
MIQADGNEHHTHPVFGAALATIALKIHVVE